MPLVSLLTLTTGTIFRDGVSGEIFRRVDPTRWNSTREPSTAPLHGIENQPPERTDAIYAVEMKTGILVAMSLETPVEVISVPAPWIDKAYRITFAIDGMDAFTVDVTSIEIAQLTIRAVVKDWRSRRVLVSIYNSETNRWVNADGSPTARQDEPQFRAAECGITMGNYRF